MEKVADLLGGGAEEAAAGGAGGGPRKTQRAVGPEYTSADHQIRHTRDTGNNRGRWEMRPFPARASC